MSKKLKVKVPKSVAGVKIPKSIRKGPVAKFLNSRAGQAVIAEALVVAAGAFTAIKSEPDSKLAQIAKHPVEEGKDAARAAAGVTPDAKKTMDDAPSRLAFALKEAARAFRAAIEQSPAEPNAWPASTAAVEPEPVLKKKQSAQNTH